MRVLVFSSSERNINASTVSLTVTHRLGREVRSIRGWWYSHSGRWLGGRRPADGSDSAASTRHRRGPDGTSLGSAHLSGRDDTGTDPSPRRTGAPSRRRTNSCVRSPHRTDPIHMLHQPHHIIDTSLPTSVRTVNNASVTLCVCVAWVCVSIRLRNFFLFFFKYRIILFILIYLLIHKCKKLSCHRETACTTPYCRPSVHENKSSIEQRV